jgi:hypothetical protein
MVSAAPWHRECDRAAQAQYSETRRLLTDRPFSTVALEESDSNEHLRDSDWIVQRLYHYAVKLLNKAVYGAYRCLKKASHEGVCGTDDMQIHEVAKSLSARIIVDPYCRLRIGGLASR